jgi:hypothetical protein
MLSNCLEAIPEKVYPKRCCILAPGLPPMKSLKESGLAPSHVGNRSILRNEATSLVYFSITESEANDIEKRLV